MPVYLFDDDSRERLLPFTHTRAVGDIRTGIMTGAERWEVLLDEKPRVLTAGHLQALYGSPGNEEGDNLFIHAAFFATEALAEAVKALPAGSSLLAEDGSLIATRSRGAVQADLVVKQLASTTTYAGEVSRLTAVWDIFSGAAAAIKTDFTTLTAGGKSAPIPDDVICRNPDCVFLEEGAVIGAGTILNTTDGPIYIGRNAEVMEGSLLRGPLSVGEGSVIKMGAKVYGGTVIGPGCKVGGEVQNVVFFANSNKGHDGYLGNSVIGEWCNLGADTNCSNLKNNYDVVKIREEGSNRNTATGLTFCGLFMGDHSKCGINTMFNTGTVVGVSCNIWGGGFQEKFIPSFTWGGTEGMTTYTIPRAIQTAERAMGRRQRTLSEPEKAVLQHVFDGTAEGRKAYHKSAGTR